MEKHSRSKWILVAWGCLNLLNLMIIVTAAPHVSRPFPWLTFVYCAAHAIIGMSALSGSALRIFCFLPETRSELIALYVVGTSALVAGTTGLAIDIRIWPSAPALLVILFMFCDAIVSILGVGYLYGTVIAERDGPVLVHYRNLLMQHYSSDAPEVKAYFEEHQGNQVFVEEAKSLNKLYARFKKMHKHR